MPVITLPDGSTRQYPEAVSVMDVAADIGPGLAKATLAGIVNGELVDASHQMTSDATLSVVTNKSEEALPLLRHSTAHLLAQAVKQLFPSAQVSIGPVIEDGFYYDFDYERSFTPEDLVTIEERMKELAEKAFPVERSTIDRDAAITYFKGLGEDYKAEIIESIPAGETLSLYAQGDFTDLCRGPHVPNTSHLKAFKLTKLAGAYWRGDSNNTMLQRIYGTAFANPKELKTHLHNVAEAEKRDHRRIGKQQDLFHLQDEAPGMVFWHPKGWAVYLAVENYMRAQQIAHGYQEIRTPQVVDFSLWEKSGHADKFGDDMFTVETDDRRYAVKPMNCPCHVQVFNQGLKSYRDLPLRLAEFGSCHRNEMSGALHGIMRVRAFTQDDAHIFCTEAQIQEEVGDFIDFLHTVYEDFGFTDVIYRLSTRPPKRVGSDEAWDKSEKALADALDAKGLPWEELPGEGAFYGPKIEFSLKDCIGRVWQCGTMQVDFSMPGRLDASYIDEHGDRQVPVMLHRAILGSFERFIGILIENFEGRLPLWLAPVQAVVMNITDKQSQFIEEVAEVLQNSGIRVQTDLRNEKIGFKIREWTLQRVPYLLVAGDREVESRSIAVRTRNGEDLGVLTLDELNLMLEQEVVNRGQAVGTAAQEG
ncbi:threonine--tRNA ligase [Granulosicoccus antarcticus]|uniref:Threonine--tRNA ligase n=1 Tax=Granulosicoccus antarcticus IMCC3135 TaxID=1192854 RepID=A0A2Z2P1B1_9GAMM|nr:threonine--tRNA ligase [Granulosicoccus antarcticus]ASJ75000.1 Threonine--tRNA ligase [Granulosicoccus antarcticus IMCC3135]